MFSEFFKSEPLFVCVFLRILKFFDQRLCFLHRSVCKSCFIGFWCWQTFKKMVIFICKLIIRIKLHKKRERLIVFCFIRKRYFTPENKSKSRQEIMEVGLVRVNGKQLFVGWEISRSFFTNISWWKIRKCTKRGTSFE